MSDPIENLLTDAMRRTRDDAVTAIIDMCQSIADQGGCANCCVEALKKLQSDLHAGDITSDMMRRITKQ